MPGALVAASAGKAAKASAKPSATMIVVCIVLFPPVAKLSLILRQLTRKEVKLTTMEPARPLVAECGQPRVIKVFIRSAGQTRLSGALVNASLDGLLPLGRPTMW